MIKKVLSVIVLFVTVNVLVAQQDSSRYLPHHGNEILVKVNPLMVMVLGGKWSGVSQQLTYKKVAEKNAYRFGINISHPQGNSYNTGHLKFRETDTSVVFREFKDNSYALSLAIGYERRVYKSWGGWYYGGDIYGGYAQIRKSYFNVEYAYSPYENTTNTKGLPMVYNMSNESKVVTSNQFLGGIQGFGGIFYDLNKRLTFVFETQIKFGVRVGKTVFVNATNELETGKIQLFDYNTDAFIGQGNLSIVYKFGGGFSKS